MQAALGNSIMGEGDSPDVHFMDTVKGSDWAATRKWPAFLQTLRP